jgi:hypothetical protein
MLAQLCVAVLPEPVDEEDEDDELGDGLEVAACAMAAPPPTRTPERVRATRTCLSRDLMSVHLLSCPVSRLKSTGSA